MKTTPKGPSKTKARVFLWQCSKRGSHIHCRILCLDGGSDQRRWGEAREAICSCSGPSGQNGVGICWTFGHRFCNEGLPQWQKNCWCVKMCLASAKPSQEKTFINIYRIYIERERDLCVYILYIHCICIYVLASMCKICVHTYTYPPGSWHIPTPWKKGKTSSKHAEGVAVLNPAHQLGSAGMLGLNCLTDYASNASKLGCHQTNPTYSHHISDTFSIATSIYQRLENPFWSLIHPQNLANHFNYSETWSFR